MIDDDVRDLMPEERRLSPQRKQHLKERLMYDIEQETNAARQGHRTKRRLIGGLVAAAVVTTGGVAAAFGFSGPDPDQAAQVIENNSVAAQVHTDGWRPTLRSEFVACIGSDSPRLTDPRDTGSTSASEFPLEDVLTADLLIEECAVSNDWARSEGGFDPAAATACVREGEYLLAVVALEGLTCAESGDDVRPIREDDLTRLNQMRTFEVAVLANPNACPSLKNALDWARVQLDVYGESLTVRGVPGDGTGCYGAMTYWDWDEVIVEQTSIPIGAGGTGVSSTSSTTTP